jgi:carboxymethylenebutenolidase
MDGDRVSLTDRALSRRSALAATTTIGAGFALAAQPVCAQTVITTPTDGLTAGNVTVKTKDGKDMMAYRAMPASGTGFGTILVVQEIFGVHEHIKDSCRRFAKAGYYAIAPDVYFRQATRPRSPTSQSCQGDRLQGARTRRSWATSIRPSLREGRGQGDTAKLGITGFCWGGRIVWLYAAHNPAVKAGVAWYGRVVGDRHGADAQASDRSREGPARRRCRASMAAPTPAFRTIPSTRCATR